MNMAVNKAIAQRLAANGRSLRKQATWPSGGHGRGVHVAGGTLRARQRADDQQPAVLQMGGDLQRRHDVSECSPMV
jgi:hypothetical protein